MGIMLMFLGIFGVLFATWLSGSCKDGCRTLWDVHQTYMKYAIAGITMLISMVVYFWGLVIRVG